MPLFEYACQNCGKVSEVLKQGRTPEPRRCPHCGAAKLKRKISVFGGLRSGNQCMPRFG